MKTFTLIISIFLLACNDVKDFPIKEHDDLKKDLVENFNQNRELFNQVSLAVSRYQIIRSINFEKGRQFTNNIETYTAPLNGSTAGNTINIATLADSKVKKILNEEEITFKEIKSLKKQLDILNCNSFYSFEELNIVTKEKYIQTIFSYNTWNGINFYYYKYLTSHSFKYTELL